MESCPSIRSAAAQHSAQTQHTPQMQGELLHVLIAFAPVSAGRSSQIKDWKNIWAPVQLICEKVSRAQIQQTYSLIFPQYKEIGADELLNSYARMRSFYKDHGRPDEAHAARIILKDFCAGKLLYAHPPPGLDLHARARFYRSFHVDGKVLIHEGLYRSPEEIAAARAKALAASVEGLGGGTKDSKEAEEAGIVGQRQLPVSTQRKTVASGVVKVGKAKVNKAAGAEESDSEEEPEDGGDGDEVSGAEEAEDGDATGRHGRSTVNQAVLNALMRDDMANLVQPSSQQSRDAAKLLAQGFNPDGTPLSKKQLQRMGQRNKKKTGKVHSDMHKHRSARQHARSPAAVRP